ncbi:hypothetical protein BQ8420_03580 [Nocardiopsis sp. JB363]|nr:hypothetical protein BQ8420_03580 [Nocardiopsis sp. JB363]
MSRNRDAVELSRSSRRRPARIPVTARGPYRYLAQRHLWWTPLVTPSDVVKLATAAYFPFSWVHPEGRACWFRLAVQPAQRPRPICVRTVTLSSR